jgi:DNA primase
MDRRSRRNTDSVYSDEQIKRVLAGSGINVESEVDSDYIIFCPFHGNHRTPAGEVDKSNGIFFCFSCHKACDLIELIMHTSGRTYFEAARFIKSKETNTDISTLISKELAKEPEFVEFDEFTVKRLNAAALESPRAMRYFNGRLITDESVRKFQLGYSDKRDMVTIPVHSPDGMCVGFVGRSVEGKEFKNSPKLPKSKTLFNLNRIKTSRQVYVVESSFDAIRLDQCGMPAVATLGASVNGTQIELLQKYFNDVIVIADNDEAGGNMKDRLVEKLGPRVSVIQLNKQYKDIGDMDDESIKNLQFEFDKSIAAMLN